MATLSASDGEPGDLERREQDAAHNLPIADPPASEQINWAPANERAPYDDADGSYDSTGGGQTGNAHHSLGDSAAAKTEPGGSPQSEFIPPQPEADPDQPSRRKRAAAKRPLQEYSATGGDETKSKKKASWFQRNKNRTITAVVLGTLGVSTGGGFLFFNLASQPLKLFSIMDKIQTKFEAAPMDAMQKITVNAVNHYISDPVLKAVYNGTCDDTISRDCSPVIANDKNPITRLFAAMKKQHYENMIAKSGLEFKKDLKTGKVTMFYNGKVALQDAVLREVADSNGKVTILQVIESNDPRLIRRGITQIAKDTTESERGMNRFLIFWGLTREYDAPRCIIACDLTDTLHISAKNATRATASFVAEHALDHVTRSYAGILVCVIDPSSDGCDVKLENSTGDIRRSPFQRALGIQLRNWSTQFYKQVLLFTDPETGKEITAPVDTVLSKVIRNLGDYFEKGTSKYIADAILEPLLGKIGEKVMPVVGWVIMAAQLESTASKVGTTLRYMGYAVTAAMVVNLYMLYATMVSEMKSGHTNIAALGSAYRTVSVNLNGTNKNMADSTASRLYPLVMGGSGVDPATSPYRCDDGSKVPAGQLVCPEERLDRGNDIATQISSIANFVPGLSSVADVITTVSNVPGAILGGAFNSVCGAIPPCAGAVQAAGSKLADFSLWLVSKLIVMPLSGGDQGDVSGARIFDMLTAGADVAYNEQCQQTLGCAKLTNQQIADIRNEVTAEQKAEFDSRPLFARLFSGDTPYSLVSQLAMVMPANLSIASSNLASLIGNPFNNLASVVSKLFAGPQAFAAAQPFDDPFGVTQYGFTSVPDDPQAYWNKNCQGDYKTAWFNAQQQDPNTGEPVATTPNYCMLIQAMVNSVGPQFDPTLAPPGTLAGSSGYSSVSARDIVWLKSGCTEEFDNGSGVSICANKNTCPDPYGLSGNCYDPVSNHKTTWISGQCSQASIAEVLNAYHQRLTVEKGALVPYYRTIDVERVGLKLGTWDGAWLNAHSPAAWQKEAAAFGMNAQLTQWSKDEKSLDQIIATANAGQPVIAGAPNHYLVIWGGDSKYIYLLDSSGHDFTWANQSTDGSIVNGAPKLLGAHTIHKATREEFLAGMGGTSEFANGYWNGETILLTPQGTTSALPQ